MNDEVNEVNEVTGETGETADTMPQQQELSVEVDGVQYPISTLSNEAQELVRMHQSWNVELSTQTDRVNQLRAAIQQVATQVVDTIRKDVAEKAADAGEEKTA